MPTPRIEATHLCGEGGVSIVEVVADGHYTYPNGTSIGGGSDTHFINVIAVMRGFGEEDWVRARKCAAALDADLRGSKTKEGMSDV